MGRRTCTYFSVEMKLKWLFIVHPDLVVCFIVSKCFAAKTGFPGRRWNVCRSWVFKMCLLLRPSRGSGRVHATSRHSSVLLIQEKSKTGAFPSPGSAALLSRCTIRAQSASTLRHLENSSGSFHSLLVNRFLIYTRTHFVKFC